MRFFSGFGFANEAELFADYLPTADEPYCAAGFSFGAIKACEYALVGDQRVDRLILLSPAFFQDKDEKFIRLQLISYAKDGASYMRNFYAACGLYDEKYIDRNPRKSDLELLLNHRWNIDSFKRLEHTAIEIYIGAKDKIVNAEKARDFFMRINAQITYIKNANHILKIEA